MTSIYLLKDYQENYKGDIISVSKNVAFGLIDSGTGRKAENRDFLVKPEIGSAKSFKKPPSRAFAKKSRGGILNNR